MGNKELSNTQGEAVAKLYLGKVQRGRIDIDQGLEEIEKKLNREGYSRGSIIGVQNEFLHLVEQYGDYRW